MKSLIDPVIALAEKAGQAILQVYSSDFEVQSKDDESPLTQADLASHHCIVAGLEKLTPGMPVISEESGLPDFEERSRWSRYWLIDPLDGTKEFVNRNGEFTVNIALIDNHRPVFGVVHVPVQYRIKLTSAAKVMARSGVMLTARLSQSVLPRPARARFGSSAVVRIVARAWMPTSKTWVRATWSRWAAH
jgi:3'(2'),5'-bisphosphate nucleotidase